MKDKRIDPTHIEVIFDKDDLVKHGLSRYIGSNDRKSFRPIILSGPFERVAVLELKDKYDHVNIKTAESIELTQDQDVRMVLKVADDNRVKLVNKHPDTLVYRLNDKTKDKKDEDIMSNVLFVNSKRACVSVKKDEFDGSEAAVAKVAKYIGQYGNIAGYTVTAEAEGSKIDFALAKDSYEFTMDSAIKKASGEESASELGEGNTAETTYPKPMVIFYDPSKLSMRGEGITKIICDGDTYSAYRRDYNVSGSIDTGLEAIFEALYTDIPEFIDMQLHLYIDGDFGGPSLDVDYDPNLEGVDAVVERVQDWIITNVMMIEDTKLASLKSKEKVAGFESNRSVAIEIAEMFINGNISDTYRYCEENGGTEMKHLVYDVLKENYGDEAADSFRRNIYASAEALIEKIASAFESKITEKVASGEISSEEAKEVYAEFLQEVYADKRMKGVTDISDDEYKYRLHILNDILPKDTYTHARLTKYMYEHDTGDMVKDLCDALFNCAVENPEQHDIIKECVGKLLMDSEIKGNANVRNIAEYLQIPVPKDTATLEVYADNDLEVYDDNDEGVINPELATGEKDLVSVVSLEGSEGLFTIVDAYGNFYFTKALLSGLANKTGSIEEISAIISSIIPGCEVRQGDGSGQYNFENGIGDAGTDHFQNLIDEAFNDDDEIGDSGLSTLDERSHNVAIAAIDKALTRFADMLETTSFADNSSTVPTDASNTNVVNKDGKTYTPTIDPATGEVMIDETGKSTYTSEDGDVQQWTKNEVTSFATNATIDPSQVISTL